MVQQVEEARTRGKTASALLKDIKRAFPNVMKGNLIKRMEVMGFEACVCRWVECFMSDRQAIMRIHSGQRKIL
jgi:hypothetical protein